MSEVLASTRKEISEEFLRGFDGMTEEPVPLTELIAAREDLIKSIVGEMTEPHRKFLLSFERGESDWALLGIPHAADVPAVKWRQQNLGKRAPAERAALVTRLEKALSKKQ